MGLRSAAEAMRLDFIGLSWERFDLAIPDRFLETAPVVALLETLHDEDFIRDWARRAATGATRPGGS